MSHPSLPLDQITGAWREILDAEFQAPHGRELASAIERAEAAGRAVYPPADLRFSALAQVPLEEVKVAIFGQDPYHRPGQAMGLAFSVPPGMRIPPSLHNIHKELLRAYGHERPKHGDLTRWAQQGVLLLNTSLTVEEGAPGSHAKLGWPSITRRLVEQLSTRRKGVIFLLWGNHAQGLKPFIDPERHHIIEDVHPSPPAQIRAERPFIGCGCFEKANARLAVQGVAPVDWRL